MLKILQARLQHYVNHELPDVQAGFRKGTATRQEQSPGANVDLDKEKFPSGVDWKALV